MYLKAPDDDRFEYYKAPEKTAGRVPRRLLHARRRRLRRRRRLPVPDRSQRAPHHLGRREHLSGRGRGGAARRTRRSATSAWSACPTTSGAKSRGRVVELQAGVEPSDALGARARRVVPRPHRALQVSAPRRLRRGAAPARQRQALQERCASATAALRNRSRSERASARTSTFRSTTHARDPAFLGRQQGRRAAPAALRACAQAYFPPRPFCPKCASRKVSWFKAERPRDLVQLRHPSPPAPGYTPPYSIAVVELDEGPRMMTNIVDCPQTPEALQLDMPVRGHLRKPDRRRSPCPSSNPAKALSP